MIRNKYKDETPINTVSKIKEILNKYNFEIEESVWKNSAIGFYSLRVTIKGTNIGANGKGTNVEFALASAYAELMERLQNQAPFRLSIDLGPIAYSYNKFYYSPDENYLSMYEFLDRDDEWTQIQLKLNKHNDIPKLLEGWKGVGYEDVASDFVALPYLNLSTYNISYIPIKMISKMYMSNGMCAGNTIEEALVQGVSEVFERYVNIKILKENLCPPTIPDNILKEYPRIYDMILEIESKGNYKVIMKDCSLNKGYPVVTAIFINRDDQTYFVKFGSHPIIEIAMERTLTELLQGQDIENMMGVREYSYEPDIINTDTNIMGILVNGSGYYPSEYFTNKYSFPFKGLNKLDISSNKELLEYLLDLLNKENYNVFVRDFSYLGFPTYQVIVPGFSEIERIDDLDSIVEYSGFVRLKKYIRNIIHLDNADITDMLKLMKDISGPTSVSEFLNLEVDEDVPWYYINIDLFKALSYYKIKDYKNAYYNFDIYLTKTIQTPENKYIYTYYKCVRDYIGTKNKYSDDFDCILEIYNFYKKSMIDDVIENYKNPENVFNNYGAINCFNCEKCSYTETCKYNNIENVYKTLKDANAKNFKEQISMLYELNL